MGEAKENMALQFLAGFLIFSFLQPASGYAVPIVAAPAGQETSPVAVAAPHNDAYAQKGNPSEQKREQWAPVVRRTVISVVQSDRIWSQWIWTSITNGNEIITDKHTLTLTEMKEWEASDVEGGKNSSPYAPVLNLPDGTPVWLVQNFREIEKLRQISGLAEGIVFYANAARVESNPDFVADRFTYYAVRLENALNLAPSAAALEPRLSPKEEWLLDFSANTVPPTNEPVKKNDGKKPSQIPAVVCTESRIDALEEQSGEMNCTAFEGSRASQVFLEPSERGMQWINAGYGDDYGFYQNAGDGKQTRYESLVYDSPDYLDWLPKTYHGVQVIGIYTSRQLLRENRIDYFLTAWPEGTAPDISISSQDHDIFEKYDPHRHIIAPADEIPSSKSGHRLYLVAFVGNGLFTEHGLSEPPLAEENQNELYPAAAAVLKVPPRDVAYVAKWGEAENIYWVWARKGPLENAGADLFESYLSKPVQRRSQLNSQVPEEMTNYLASAEFGLGILIASERRGNSTILRYESGSVILENLKNPRIREISTASGRLEFVRSDDRLHQELFSFEGRNPEKNYVALINRAPQPALAEESLLLPEASELIEKAYRMTVAFIDRLDPHKSEREAFLRGLASAGREAGLFAAGELLRFYVREMDRLIKIGKSIYKKIDERMIARTQPGTDLAASENNENQISQPYFVEEDSVGYFEIFVFNPSLGIPSGPAVMSGILSFDGTPVFNMPAPAHLILSSEPVPPPVIPVLADRFPVPLRSQNVFFREELDPLQIQNNHHGDGG